jgi:hypothetical protein
MINDNSALSNWILAPTQLQFSAIADETTQKSSDCRYEALSFLANFWDQVCQR